MMTNYAAQGLRVIRHLIAYFMVSLLVFAGQVWAQAAVPPPNPSSTSTVGASVTNPVTELETTVSALVRDPAGTPTVGDTAFVETADGYIFLVKGLNQTFYNKQIPPRAFLITAIAGNTATVSIGGQSEPFPTRQTIGSFNSSFNIVTPGDDPRAPDVVTGPNGVTQITYGDNGGNGRAGALFVPPSDGRPGQLARGSNDVVGSVWSPTLSTDINATNRAGWIVGNVGGDGGNGGSSNFSFWSAGDGGNAASGGPVTATQSSSSDIATSGNGSDGQGNDGIFVFSRSGKPGDGGGANAAPGGGSGGGAANGGTVRVNVNGTISTTGVASDGVFALSQSNTGGRGGTQWGLVGAAGGGGTPGNGGAVNVTTNAGSVIETSNNYANGILANSVGGSGGSAGSSFNLIVALNGEAGAGGNGGTVAVTNNGTIRTEGNFARGIVAQSIGGGGGSGGNIGGLVSLSVGGVGPGGGSASAVTVTNGTNGVIRTDGLGADGIMAQSVGGSGGVGTNATGLVALGGSGSAGGTGGAVTVRNFGRIDTFSALSRGIIAQSIGGGGGDGGNSAGMVSIGGSGSGARSGAKVEVLNDGIIHTRAADSIGIVAQSIGGGGGNGGSAGSVSAFLGVAVGGTGSSGASGGEAVVTLSNTDPGVASFIKTEGDRSGGVFVQSVGGGGGNGGGAVQATLGAFGAASIAIGGNGGSGGSGGNVSLSGTGDAAVETGGTDAAGVILQSVGGGGGNGGYAISAAAAAGPVGGSLSVALGGKGSTGGNGGTVSVGTFTGNTGVTSGFDGSVLTTNDRSLGMLFQSVGGGGGNGGIAVSASASAALTVSGAISVGIGGDGAAGGTGGTVRIFTNSTVVTGGDSSPGLIVQSVGGGGGNGGGSVTAALSAGAGGALSVGVGQGGSGGAAGAGGQVVLISTGDKIETKGKYATAVLAQSVGGSGGNGGYAVAASAAFGGGAAGAVTVSLGGKGGAGGAGGAVTARVESEVLTLEEESSAVVIQSVGGGGGNGGFSVSAGLAAGGGVAGTVNVGLGGAGATGSTGGNVTGVQINGNVETRGARSTGVIVQSVGGGGGNGGFNVSAGVAGAGGGAGAIAVGLGGTAGGGGAAGIVDATVAGNVTTNAVSSSGVVLQSIGGGGGNGGFNVSAGAAGAGLGGGAVTVGLGGKGATGGIGNNVTGTVGGDVTTLGDDATAVLAQSVGGGGGNGGFNVSGSLAGAGVGAGAVSVGLGGEGGAGQNAGAVELTSNGIVNTTGNRSAGVVAQSLGGGGGNGGFNVSGGGSGAGTGSGTVAVGLGGKGSGGGNAGTVNLTSNGTITTRGENATAFLAQSVGGGGGNGGFNVSGSVTGAGVGSGAVSVGLGGDGSGGGDGNVVIARSTAAIETQKDGSSGLVAQSIGGGGGNGGFDVSASVAGAGTGSGAVSVSLGGNGGGAGAGGAVTLTSTATIVTKGADSTAFLAQSVGGGGGNGGFSVAPSLAGAGTGAGAISVGLGGAGGGGGGAGLVIGTSTAAVRTEGARSSGVVAQSVGGGGGNGGFTVAPTLAGAGTGSGTVGVGLGGKGGTASDGGEVSLTSHGTILTLGEASSGFVAQSLGGGGGNGGYNITAALSGAGTGAGAVSVGLGGDGAGGGAGGKVTALSTAAVETRGDSATGVLAQSIGGGGGNGGFNVSATIVGAGTGAGGASIGLGGKGDKGGVGGEVKLTSTATIVTRGFSSSGLVAQSIGGGGGNGGFNVSGAITGAGTGAGALSVSLGGSGAEGGNGGIVTASSADNITTFGNASTGILAQSVGGGGGNGGFSVSAALAGAGTGAGAVGVGLGGAGAGGGDGDAVDLTVTNNVTTFGAQSAAIIAQSIGGGGGNGGFNVSAAVGGAGTGAGAGAVGLGGSGAGGGTGGSVKSDVTGNLITASEQSVGLLVQSVGGGGGNGGLNVSVAVAGAQTGAGGVSVGLGGGAGIGGAAGAVDSTLEGNVTTFGIKSAALLAGQTRSADEAAYAGGVVVQSVGGGGGNGGVNVSATVTASTSGASGGASVGLGGSGGDGGAGATAKSVVTGNVVTNGDMSGGIRVQSAGGGGGAGGVNVSGAINFSGSGGGAAAIGIGGSGGSGGSADDVTSTVTGNVTTNGIISSGIVAQSVGGGGGDGGVNVSGAISFAKSGSGVAAIGVGGFGGDGGTAGAVTGTVTGDVTTDGLFSSGIVAQSLGGGGGNGGINVSGAISVSNSFSGAVGIGVGGFGGDGGGADNVTHTVTGNVRTAGDFSTGIMSQSLGGGGGNGGTNVSAALSIARETSGAIALGVGGFGGGGADAGDLVMSDMTGGVTTLGNYARGVVTQSIGGGGGDGAVNVSAAVNLTQNNGGAVTLGVGGFGGGAGNGKTVDATLRSGLDSAGAPTIIATMGAESTGITAQSVGGGGGTGGVNVSGAVSLSGKSGAAISLGLGGFGGGGGNGGAVNLDVVSDVVTMGHNSDGLFAQSLGGGGGNGGTNIAGSLSLTKPSGSDTILSMSVGVGGFGGDGGDADAVDLSYTGKVTAIPMEMQPDGSFTLVEKNGANGIVAQSLGGGGGNGGVNVAAGISIDSKPGAGQSDTNKSGGIVIGVGGFGGGGGDAGTVDVSVGAGSEVFAHGTGKSGVLAQSLGRGGGNGGLNVSGAIVSDTSLIVGIGGFGGGGGLGRDVTVDADVDIVVTTNPDDHVVPDDTTFETKLRAKFGDDVVDTAEGLSSNFGLNRLLTDIGIFNEDKQDTDGSAGLLAQSIGGGGGNGGLNVSGGILLNKDGKIPSVTFGIGGFGGVGNAAGHVDARQAGSINVAGNWKHGLLAQSIGGGGGNGGLNVTGQLNYASSDSTSGATDMSIVAGLGGHGGLGADAGDVDVVQSGAITTKGYHARGLFAQSIGGGGGNGGINVSFVATQNSSPIAIGIGGFGSGGGHAGAVTVARGTAVTAAGLIQTDGIGAHGIEATSIGGGGGDAGVNAALGFSKTSGSASNGGTGDSTDRKTPVNSGVDDSVITNYNAVLDELEGKVNPPAAGGGGGQKDSMNAVVAIGGAGGNAGNGGAVDVRHFGTVETRQDGSHGVFGQSIGGGGGNAALNLGVIKEFGSPANNKGFGMTIGGGTGDGGLGGAVDVRNTGNITTMGADSHGMFAQSVGGGGGNAGYDMVIPAGKGGNVSIQIGRTGGTGGAAGDVYASSDGAISTAGDASFGLFAQSVGNGGGSSSASSFGIAGADKSDDEAGDSMSLAVGLEGGIGGAAGDVAVAVAGSITTAGIGAHGVFAQAVGGGGGMGGVTSSDATTGTSIGISIGGNGGSGGTGGKVDVTTGATIITTGDQSIGVAAQSIGGAGGVGGYAKAGVSNIGLILGLVSGDNVGTSTSLNIGGTGGDGMTSDTVTVTNTGMIGTRGMLSHGIFAQSVGGGGGMGGLVENRVINLRGKVGTNSALSIGGSGGTGAVSAQVTVTNENMIQTAGERAAAIFAQSVGGGGGDADQVRNIIFGPSADSATTNAVLFGGSGGAGGAGAGVTVTNSADASILTEGTRGYGIFAQSVGGGGGNGGTTVSIDARSGGSTATTSRAIQLGLGGSGGTGGTAGLVTVTNDGTIVTRGNAAHAILAQSIGGGGGNGGSSFTGTFRLKAGDAGSPTAQLNIGGFGGTGNSAGNVIVNNGGDVQVDGAGAYGILAQSVGGGGGNGGMAASMNGNDLKDTLTGKSFTNIAIGGFGGGGDDAGDVTVNHTGTIIVNGTGSYGIYAQSVGGGGGTGGYSVSSPVVSLLDFGIKQVLGATNIGAGASGDVNVNTTGDIIVNGEGSEAVFVQTVNGGGGSVDVFVDLAADTDTTARIAAATVPAPAGTGSIISSTLSLGGTNASDTAGADISQSHSGVIGTTARRSAGMILQSIGGGGGSADNTVAVVAGDALKMTAVLGAIDTDNSGGGAIDASRTGDLVTSGDLSVGGLAQSIGGGGGKMVLQNETDGAPTRNQRALITLGADPSMGNDGGRVLLMLVGDMETSGDFSSAQVVQSIGAGGGDTTMLGFGRAVVDLGAQDGSTGNGGAIELTNDGNVATSGEQSHGFVLQSIGGGGGLVTTDLAAARVKLALSSDNEGDGGDIAFETTGHIIATGQDAIGVLAQSIGGGGGAVDALFRGSAGGAGQGAKIDLSFGNNVMSTAKGGIAVFAQSTGGDGGDDITLSFDGLVIGGTGAAEDVAAVIVDGGGINRLSFGTDSLLIAGNNQAMNGSDGADRVVLRGSALGNFELGAGANRLTVADGATLYALDTIDLGQNGQMVVNGNLWLGAGVTSAAPLTARSALTDFAFTASASQTVAVTGGLTFGSTSVYTADVYFRQDGRFGGDSDLINVSGDAVIGGTLLPQLNALERALPLVLIDADGTRTDAGTTIPDTVVLDYAIGLDGATGDGSTIDLVITPDFSIPGMTGNQAAVGDYINGVLNGQGSAELGALFALIGNMTDRGDVIAAIDRLTAAEYAANNVDVYYGARRFADVFESCEKNTPVRWESYEHACAWITGSELAFARDATENAQALRIDGHNLTGGFRIPVQDSVYLGLAMGQETTRLDNGSYQANGKRDNFGISLTKFSDPWEISAMLTFGSSRYDGVRAGSITGTLPNGTLIDTGPSAIEQTTRHRNLRLSGAYRHDLADQVSYVKTGLAFDATRLETHASAAAGRSGSNLQDTTQTVMSLTPSVELGTELAFSTTTDFRANVRASAIVADSDAIFVTSGLAGASAIDGGFRNISEIDKTLGQLSVNMGFYAKDDMSYVNYAIDRTFGKLSDSTQASVTFGIQF